MVGGLQFVPGFYDQRIKIERVLQGREKVDNNEAASLSFSFDLFLTFLPAEVFRTLFF